MANKEVTWFILSAVVAAVHALSVNTPQKHVQVKKGENITLPCTYESSVVNPADGDVVAWMKMPNEVEIINQYLHDGGIWITDAYKGRVNFSGNTNNRDIGIILSQATLNDNGTYECSVRIRADLPSRQSRMELLVLVPPSKPDCKIIGTTEYGQNINLTCNSIEGSPKPEYSWQSYNPENKQRALVGTVTPGVLMLKNISTDTTGYYICLSKNSAGESLCNITVNVTPPSMNFALLGGVIGGLVAVIIIIAVVAYCCCCRNGKDKDYEMTETENGDQPPDVKIRGPAEEEIQDEEEEEEDRHYPVQPPISRVSPEV
ncbi:cell surface A33 antigen [Lacerta agilis]|uniref:cell surface A33 antigen n=1 Tax=Lacerta agilis TaxID=80427 RepID=UPI00141A139F|nr:cell surface A33 antigen [Lacerta agilis]